jgi:hypothetical protein
MIISHDRYSPDEGVSESIGFLLIFTLVIAGIGLVTLYGYPMLTQQQVSADEQIMEKNMIVLQNDIKSLAYKTVPYKETSLKIGGGSLTVYNTSVSPATSTISISDEFGNHYVKEFHSGDLRYESVNAQTDISLQNGAVVKRDRIVEGSVMLSEPRWFYDGISNTMVINLISINSTGIYSRTGIGTVQMALRESNYTYEPIAAGVEVYVDYTPDTDADFSTAWDNYFINSLMLVQKSGAVSPPTIRYVLPFDNTRSATLVIKKYDILIKSL